ncbi:MAG: copper resistance D family protein [Rhodanobacteraceae bacterium]
MLACRFALLPGDAGMDLRNGVHNALGIALGLVTVASFGILVSRTLEMDGGAWGTLFTDMGVALKVTHFGHIWRWRVPALALAWLAYAWSLRHRRAWATWLVVIAIAAIALTRSDTGHPADHGDFTAAVWVDWLHLLSAGTWVGSLFGMTLVVFPRLLRAGRPGLGLNAEVFQRLSTLSGVALAVVVGAGIYNAITQLGGFAGLWTSRYGITLDVKLAIVIAMIAFGAHNRYVKLPRLLHASGGRARWGPFAAIVRASAGSPDAGPVDGAAVVRACARAVLIEAVLGLIVIGATANLIHATPPGDRPPQGASGSMVSQAAMPRLTRVA